MTPRWIDTHNHLFVLPHEQQKAEVTDARACGVASGLICAGGTDNFEAAIRCAHEWDSCYALALHPLYLRESWRSDLQVLEEALLKNREDPRLAAVGECGLDFSDDSSVPRDVQEEVFSEHLKLARKLKLPLSLHGRGAMDIVLKHLRRIQPLCGVIHAFNGSAAQAEQFIKLGFKIGYGGAMTYNGSKRIRALLAALPEHAWVLETDCPDIPPSRTREREENPQSVLADIADYGLEAAELRSISPEESSRQSLRNTLEVFPAFSTILAAAPQ